MKPNIGTLNVRNTNYNIRNKLYLVKPANFVTLINTAYGAQVAQPVSREFICRVPGDLSIAVISTDNTTSISNESYGETLTLNQLSTGDILESATLNSSDWAIHQRVIILEDVLSTNSGQVHIKIEPRLPAIAMDGAAILYGKVSSDGVLSISFPKAIS